MKLTDIVTNPSIVLNKVSYKALPIIDDNGNDLNVNEKNGHVCISTLNKWQKGTTMSEVL